MREFDNKTILITGDTGSFGKEATKYLDKISIFIDDQIAK
jgi:FlaA1/EpsC-like NDP-sugar epimerase|tara:strand:- start:77 stop:196 length:120 start_codon:yes stop_codon:yes gene_type:complete